MDPISQAGLGAVVAQAAGHRRLGYQAALFGAAAGALPDIDVLFSIGGDFVDQLITHRGITHSLFFAPVVGPLLGWLIWWREKRRDPTLTESRRTAWIVAMTLALLSHPLLDLFTSYGTQLLLPFSNQRFAIDAMPIIDPVYTVTLILGLGLAWLLGRRQPGRAPLIALLTLALSSSYVGYGGWQNLQAEAAARTQLAASGIVPDRVGAFPTILQVYLRRVVARTAGMDRVGFYSTWAPCEITWFSAPRANPASYSTYLQTREGRVFDWFSMGWAHYSVSPADTGTILTVSDLRYGFDDDPLASVFTVRAELDQTGAVTRPGMAGRTVPGDTGRVFERLLTDTYAPACQIFSRGVIPPRSEENDAP